MRSISLRILPGSSREASAERERREWGSGEVIMLAVGTVVFCERSELLICKVHQLGLGRIKNCAH